MLKRLRALLPERALALDIGVLFSGFTLQLLTQVGWLVLALRVLGPDGYGLFASLTAVTVALSFLVGLGSDQLLIRHVAAEPAALRRWLGHGLLATTATGLPLALLLLLLLPLAEIGRIGTGPLLAVLLADLLCGRYANLCTVVAIATGQAGRQSQATVLVGALRLAAIALAGLLPGGLSIAAWAWWYLGASTLAALGCLALVVRDHGWPIPTWINGHWREGTAFAAEAALQASVADLDKPIVLQLAGPTEAGLYAATFRIIGTLYLPLRALGYAFYGRLFRRPEAERPAYGLRMLPAGLGIGLAAALGVLLCADLLPLIFGPAYAALPPLLRLVCLMPAAYGAFYLGADVLSATRRQPLRLGIVTLSLALTLALCWLAVPLAGIEGASLARLGVQGLAALAVWAFALRRLPPAPAPTGSPAA
ncbi:oligosaccharide flippase family protein [Roseomonas sp. GC11]|uniref:lipopolysaccharide biosynthesis protein n=1 Tax=Roseomonas sp. GC11 TaxID=2950546 RepID=UPI002108C917|nr:oligosaccharide flippase family protein [Roseomonas sp. GC11]MCQ4161108.1 oligosaccharide flippase family protein [Roseomonas sp. GC11]